MLTDEEDAVISGLFPGETRRHAQNRHYAKVACAVLADDPQFSWLCDRGKMLRGEPNAWRPTILAEIGRLSAIEDMQAAAAIVCAMRLKTKNAVAMIRALRLGKTPKADHRELTGEICKALDDYRMRHPKVTKSIMLQAMREAIRVLIRTDFNGEIEECRIEEREASA